AAVRVDRQAGDRRIEAVGQRRAVIHVAVVGRDSAGDGGVLGARIGVGKRKRRNSSHWQRARPRRGRVRPVLVGNRVIRNNVRRRTLGQVLVSLHGALPILAAVRVDRQAGDRRIEAVGQRRAVIHVAVVGRDSAGDGGVLGARIGDRKSVV